MIFFLTILQLIHAEYIAVMTNSETVIERFDGYGEVFYQEIQYEKNNNLTFQPCHFTKQKLQQTQQKQISIIQEFKEDYFSEQFQEGHFQGQVDEILAAVQIESGSIILTKQGKLKHIKIKESNITLGEEIEINFKTDGRIFMMYLQGNSILLLIGHEQTLALQFKNSSDIFENYTQLKIYDKFDVSKIKSITTANDMLFIALGEAGIQMYQFKEKTFQSVPWIVDGNIVNSFANAVDVKAFSKNQNSVYLIFVLDKVLGVQQYIYNQITTLISQNTKFPKIPQTGDILDVQNEIIMIVDHQISNSLIYEYKINYTDFTCQQINTHLTFKQVEDIDILSHYVIVLGKGGHQIFKHSIPKLKNNQYTNNQNNQLIIPNLKQLYHQDLKNETYIFGYTTHKYFLSKIKESKIALFCYSNITNFQNITFTYIQKSTQCPDNSQKEFCEIQNVYTVNFKQPKTGANLSRFILYIGVSGVLGLGFILLTFMLYKKYKQVGDLPEYIEWNLEEQSQRIESDSKSPQRFREKEESKFSEIKLQKISQSPQDE